MSEPARPPVYPDPARRTLITLSVVLATMIVTLDTTIANVALPYMQSSLSASPEQVIWVLTSYLIASAIMTPLSSWLAGRFGRKLVMAVSAGGFTLASLGCGLAGSLEMMVAARLIQGICGAGLIPLGQAMLLDINPPERQGKAMAMVGLGAMLGPLAGPSVGGWLTDAFTWRAVFLINLPLGVLAFAGLATFMPESRDRMLGRFDLFGFATLSIFLGAFQLMLDRGQTLDWFDSPEVCIEAGIMALFGYLAVVHMLTARGTFVRAEMFTDRNFVLGCLISSVIGIVSFATIPIVTVMMQAQLGYSAFLTGLVSMPRGIGTVIGLLVVSNMIGRIEPRILLMAGLTATASSLYLYSRLSLETDQIPLLWAGLLQGLAGGLMLAPLTLLVFSTLPSHFRNEGAAIYSLTRNMGASLGISALQSLTIHNTASVSARLGEGIRPDNAQLALTAPQLDLASSPSLQGIAGQVWRQAGMVGTIDALWLTCVMAIAIMPLALLLKPPRKGGAATAAPQSAPLLDGH